jgi:glycogen synthase
VERGLSASKIHRVGVGVDPEQLAGGDAARFRESFPHDGPVVLQVSTMSRAKGAIDLVEAMKLLWAAGSDARLVLIGPNMGDFEEYFTSQPPDVRRRTHFLGHTTEETKKDAFAACDVFVMASSADSFGTVYLEAWLYGKPVVGADAGGVPDVVTDGRDGLLVTYGRPRELADAIDRLLGDAELRRALGESGRRKVLEEYTWDIVFGRLWSVVEPLLAEAVSGERADPSGLRP